MNDKTVALYLMTSKGFSVLEHFVEDFGAAAIEAVICHRDKNVTEQSHSEIVARCEAAGIKHFDRTDTPSLKSAYAFAIGWRWLIADSDTKLIVLHDSLLPRYRGFAPLVSCLVNREDKLGVTALFAADEYDRGEVIAQAEIPVSYPLKIADAIEKISPLYYRMVKEIAQRIFGGQALASWPQDETRATYSLWRNEDDYVIDWKGSAEQIQRFVDAVGSPYLGASSFVEGVKVRITEVAVAPEAKIENRTPGKVIFVRDGKPVIVCGAGLLRIEKMADAATGTDLLPFKRFRVRFCSNP
jgi:methionyl-tRNA formyltransferase